MSNRRNKARHALRQQVHVKFYRVGGMPDLDGRLMPAHLSDVSEGGVGVALERLIPVDTRIDLRVSLADPPSSFSHTGIVRWSTPVPATSDHRMGIEFVGGSDTHMEEWRRVVRQLSRPTAG